MHALHGLMVRQEGLCKGLGVNIAMQRLSAGGGAHWKGWKKRHCCEISSPASRAEAWRSWPPSPCVVVTPINKHTPLNTKYSCLQSQANHDVFPLWMEKFQGSHCLQPTQHSDLSCI